MKSKNPHNICTWDEQANCASCSIKGELHCKWDRRVLNGFYAASFPPLIIAIMGMVIVGILTGGLYAVFGIPFAILLGLVTGILNIVPFVGLYTGLALALLVAFLTA